MGAEPQSAPQRPADSGVSTSCPEDAGLNADITTDLLQAFLIEKDDGSIGLVGNRTEGALLMLLRGWGRNYKTVRANRHEDVAQLYGFSSAKKMANVMLKTYSGLRLYNKVCLLCSKYMSCSSTS